MRTVLGFVFLLVAVGFFALAGWALTRPEPAAPSDPGHRSALPPGQASPGPAIDGPFSTVSLAYNRPTVMRLDRASDVVLLIDPTQQADLVSALQGYAGDIISAETQVTPDVSASLLGNGFEIERLNPERQKLSGDTPNRWQWRVVPKAAGERELILQVFAHRSANGAAEPIRAYADTIQVTVTVWDQAYQFAKTAHPVIGFLAGGVSLLIAGVTLAGKRRKRKAEKAAGTGA